MGTPDEARSNGDRTRKVLLAAAPLAAAIAVFGTIYGATATSITNPARAILSSVLIFSGAVQFALVGLLITGASPLAAVTTAVMLNARNLLLGAVVRDRMVQSRPRRALLAWWLTDEAAGLALSSDASPGKVLLVSGAVFYGAWIGGTAAGAYGASLASLEGLAAAVFPVLFVGLAALSARGQGAWLRASVAAALSGLLAIAVPSLRGIVPVAVAVIVALPPSR